MITIFPTDRSDYVNDDSSELMYLSQYVIKISDIHYRRLLDQYGECVKESPTMTLTDFMAYLLEEALDNYARGSDE